MIRSPILRSPILRSSILRSLALAVALPAALSACVTVFPKPTPAQTYRFGDVVPPPAQASAPQVLVAKGATIFPAAASADRILTVNGRETAFIAGARWVTPAQLMFDDAVLRAFDAPGAPRLVERGEVLAAPSTLRLDVRTFEVRYPGPSAVVEVRATLSRTSDRGIVAEKMFQASVPAADNRQGPIVAAFDAAAGRVIADIRDWTAANAPAR